MADKKNILRLLRNEDLARSGLQKPGTIKRLGIGDALPPLRTEAITGVEQAASYEIPYHDLSGKRIKYSRYKLLPVGEEELGIKYWQEEKTIPHLYVPPLAVWTRLAEDVTKRLIITEGEKKAACATLLGMPCISVGGVWSWKAKSWGMLESIPDFDWFQWSGRSVEVCYDGDMYANDNVSKAMAALTATLSKRGARVFVRYLPMTEGISKLDDYLVQKGVDSYRSDLLCEEAEFSRELSMLNERVLYVEKLNNYLAVEDGQLLRDEKALDRRFGTTRIVSETGKPIKATTVWAEWPHRRSVRDITYEPGKERFFNGMYNEWRGWGTQPQRGNVKQILEVIREVDGWEWLLQWMAYPIQHPGAKLLTAVVLWSVEQGTGKSFVGKVLRRIYGERNSGEITSTALHDGRFTWVANKQIVIGEEVSNFSHRFADYNALKSVITSDTIRVDPKFVAPHELPNKANFMFNSNDPAAMRIELEDRRFFVGELSCERPDTFWRRMDKHLWREGGTEAFHWYLLNAVDLTGFNPRGRAPLTDAKSEMIISGMGAAEQWCHRLLEDKRAVIAESLGSNMENAPTLTEGRDVFTVAQIREWLPDDLRKSTQEAALGRFLKRAGAVKLRPQVRVGGRILRLIAVDNLTHWRGLTTRAAQWVANFEGKVVPLDKRKRRKKT